MNGSEPAGGARGSEAPPFRVKGPKHLRVPLENFNLVFLWIQLTVLFCVARLFLDIAVLVLCLLSSRTL